MDNKNNKKIACYIRVSTLYQVDKDSLPFQRKELVNYAEYVLGIKDHVVFEDAGYSGKDTERPAYQDMMKRIRNGEFTHLLVWKLDRISRNLLDFASMYDELKKYKITFVSKNEQFDTSSAMGEAMLKIILVFAELERKITAERVYSIMLSRANKGLWNGGSVPLGYKWSEEKKFAVIDENEAHKVELIFDTYEKLKSTSQLSDFLNSAGIPTKRDKRWNSRTLSQMIRNPFYKGTYRYNYREAARGKVKNEDEWILIDDNHDAIISTEQWERCNAIMDGNNENCVAFHKKGIHTHLFSKILVCSHCGKGMNSQRDIARDDGFQPSIYRCQSKMLGFECSSTKIASDVKIAPFIFQLISNIVRYQNDFENQCLKSRCFKNVEDIEITNPIYDAEKEEYILDGTEPNVSYEFLMREKEKYVRALERLEKLYLFSDDAMSEKDYLIRKREITEKIKELKIPEREEIQDDFIEQASYFILTNEMLNKKNINYKKIVTTIDKDVLKEFLDLIIDKVYIDNNVVSSVRFKNQTLYSFKYKSCL